MGALDEAKDNLADGFTAAKYAAEDVAEFVKDKSGDAADFIIGKAEQAKSVIADKIRDDEDQTPAS